MSKFDERDIEFIIDTVADFTSVPKGVTTVLVKDQERGGVFNRIASTTADNGIIFDGTGYSWKRLFKSPPSVAWFGDLELESTYQNAFDTVGESCYVPTGTYNLDADTVDFTTYKFHSFGVVTINVNTTLTVTNLNP
ncbi:hypothetical protein [uncultured Arcobacter sp.]|uniref:hypothetical protein n=1 Tax=uncultured Arcobacter sp. TaxID=165434 RepID=UPI00263487BF|nr:hypothetical protein [uncultured Arcobacter sp.]